MIDVNRTNVLIYGTVKSENKMRNGKKWRDRESGINYVSF